jgi:hypothetical protein
MTVADRERVRERSPKDRAIVGDIARALQSSSLSDAVRVDE